MISPKLESWNEDRLRTYSETKPNVPLLHRRRSINDIDPHDEGTSRRLDEGDVRKG